ncbi:hypothetical protein ACFVJ5_07010 [Nocardia sp. NPDC127606]|uniref:hypothetical protein n=1 Tax=Nocardia sp. NPDC127606 TaxID=3345406 RepID=UPI00362AFFFC
MAALGQVTVPYRHGYDIGVGADLASGSPMGFAVVAEASPVDDAKGAAVTINLSRATSTEDVEDALGINVAASYGCASFGAGASARFDFARQSKVHTSALFMMVSITVELAFLSVDAPRLTEVASKYVDNATVFETRYGNMFVRGLGRGGVFLGVMRIETRSEDEASDVAANLAGSYGLFSLDAKMKLSNVQQKFQSEISILMYHEGGPVDLAISNPADPLELLDNANKFLKSFTDDPVKYSRPYFVTLAPIAIAEGPLPPSVEELQNVQDVLVYCAKRRSALLDQLNLLDYIADHPNNYDFSKSATLDEVRTQARLTQQDLDLLSQCAIKAINNPKGAVRPAVFAVGEGEEYPVSALPNPMPLPVAGAKPVTVPDFRGCATFAACQELAERSGLGIAYEDFGEPKAFQVIDFRPPRDSIQPEGTVITIVCPPSPPIVWTPTHSSSPRDRPWLKRLP